VELISIGNGTASRETDKLAMDLIKQLPEWAINKLVVSEAGASVYSASEFAAKEFPELDVTLRGARIHCASLAGSAGGIGQNRS